MTSHTRGMHTLMLWSSAAAMIWLAGTAHARSPREAPDKQTANPDNSKPERQLDEVGRNTAIAMGKALRDLRIPIGNVLSSPTYRALETVHLAQFGAPQTFVEFGDNGQSMQGGTAAQAEWLQKQVAHFPTGTNTIVVTHLPNITGAFPQLASGLVDGEALIFGPDAKQGDSRDGSRSTSGPQSGFEANTLRVGAVRRAFGKCPGAHHFGL